MPALAALATLVALATVGPAFTALAAPADGIEIPMAASTSIIARFPRSEAPDLAPLPALARLARFANWAVVAIAVVAVPVDTVVAVPVDTVVADPVETVVAVAVALPKNSSTEFPDVASEEGAAPPPLPSR